MPVQLFQHGPPFKGRTLTPSHDHMSPFQGTFESIGGQKLPPELSGDFWM